MSTEDYKELRPMDHSFFASVLIAPYLEEFSIFPSLPSFLCILLLLHHVLHPKYLIQCKAGEITSNIRRLFSVEQLGGRGKHSHPKGDWMQCSGPHSPLYCSIFSKV